MPYRAVFIKGCELKENRSSDGVKKWTATNLIAHAADLEPFDLPLIAIYSGSHCWAPIESAYALATHMRRVMNVDTTKPVIMDQEGYIMDGWHRVARALLDGAVTIPAVRFDETPAPDYEVQG